MGRRDSEFHRSIDFCRWLDLENFVRSLAATPFSWVDSFLGGLSSSKNARSRRFGLSHTGMHIRLGWEPSL